MWAAYSAAAQNCTVAFNLPIGTLVDTTKVVMVDVFGNEVEIVGEGQYGGFDGTLILDVTPQLETLDQVRFKIGNGIEFNGAPGQTYIGDRQIANVP